MKPRLVFLLHLCLLSVLLYVAMLCCSCTQDDGTGTLRILLHSNSSKTIAPDESVNRITKYTVRGSGPGGKSFTMDSTSSSVVLEGMPLGRWSLSATASSSKGRELARGSASVNLSADQEPVTLILDAVTGKGSMQIRFEWDNALTGVTVKASLSRAGSTSATREQTFNPQSGVSYCTWTVSDLDEGSYILNTRLFSNSVGTGGATEAVVIACGEKTAGTIRLTSDGSWDSDPSARIEGLSEQMASGQSHTVTLVPENYYGSTELCSVTWYMDGKQISQPRVLNAQGNSLTFTAETGVHTISAVITGPGQNDVTSASYRFTAKPRGKEGCAVYSSCVMHTDAAPLYLNANQIIRPFAGKYFLSASPEYGTLQMFSFNSGVLNLSLTLTYQDSLWSHLYNLTGMWADYRTQFAGFTDSNSYVNIIRLKDGELEYALFGDIPEITGGKLSFPSVTLKDIRCGSINTYDEDTCIFFSPPEGNKIFMELTDTYGIKSRCGILKPDNTADLNFVKASGRSIICAGKNTGTLHAALFDGIGTTSGWKANTTTFRTISHAHFLSDTLLILSDGRKLSLYSSTDGMTWTERRTSTIPALDISAVPDKGLFYVLTAADTLSSYRSNGTVIEHLGSSTIPFEAVSIAAGPDHVLAVSADGDIAIFEIAGGEI